MWKVGEICIITFHDDSNYGLVGWGPAGIWVGYAGEHPVGTFCKLNSQKINLTHDVTFLVKSHGE